MKGEREKERERSLSYVFILPNQRLIGQNLLPYGTAIEHFNLATELP